MEQQAAQGTAIEAPPNIENTPARANETVTHYGYVAYHDINLTGPGGQEYQVQPADSPYYQSIPARRMIPFTNITTTVPNEKLARATSPRNRAKMASKQEGKTARQCAEEIRDSYQPWGFTILNALTGLDTETAFRIFRTIQPFDYSLIDLVPELEYNAEDRIEQDPEEGVYEVSYREQVIELEPLTATEKELARDVLRQMRTSGNQAFDLAEERRETTTQSLTSYFAGQGGKKRPDPLDRYIFDQLGAKIPQLVRPEDAEKPQQIDGEALGAAVGEGIKSAMAELRSETSGDTDKLNAALIERLEAMEKRLEKYEAQEAEAQEETETEEEAKTDK